MHIPTLLDPDVETMVAGHVAIIEGSLSEGFELPYMSLVVVTERELFKSKQKKSTKKRRKTLSNAEKLNRTKN